jgi:predicted nuclease of predicted toxin-antitoxin system
MRFLVDECLHESLVSVAHAAGFEATHVNHLGLSGKPDWALAERIAKDEFTFVTNNRADFVQLFGSMELHAGLIVIVPNLVPTLQRALFDAAIQYLAGRNLINAVIEVTLDSKIATCVEYQTAAGLGPAPPVRCLRRHDYQDDKLRYALRGCPSVSLPDLNGGRGRTRTCDLLRVKQAL